MFFAETTTGQALDVLQNSFNLSEATAQSWASLWEDTIFAYHQSELWIALVAFGFTLAALSVIYLAITEGKTIIEKQAWSELITILVWPLVVAMFLGNNGALLAQTIQVVRGVGLHEINEVQEIQLAGFTLQQALEQISISNAAREQIDAIYNECLGQQGQDFTNCLLQNQAAVEHILESAEQTNGGTLDTLNNFVQGIWGVISNPSEAAQSVIQGEFAASVFRNIAIPILRFVLSSLQWGFVNILEAALLLTALVAPLAMGLSLLPLQGRPIVAWLISFCSLLAMQLGYNIVVGLAAIVIVHSHGELATDIAFLFFLALFAPILAVLISSGGGIAIYQGITQNLKRSVDLLSSGLSRLT